MSISKIHLGILDNARRMKKTELPVTIASSIYLLLFAKINIATDGNKLLPLLLLSLIVEGVEF